jgi:heme-degrading monooxygenase HmoA
MFVRLGSFEVKAGALDTLRTTYNEECVPLVKGAEGNVDCFLLEPVVEGDAMVACTMWKTEEDAVRYESSGTAQEVVSRVRSFFAGPPKLQSYRVRRS